MADWNAVKTEYITTNTSYRKLAEKYGVHYTNIAKMAKSENWQQLRQQQADKTLTKALNSISSAQAARAVRLQNVAEKLLVKVEALVDATDPLEMDTQSLRHISATLKDIKEIQMVKSDADMREQEARIANLKRQAEKADNTPNTIEIVFEAGPEEWNE